MNRVTLVGRLAHDPELRFTQNGKAVTSFSLAVDKPFSKDEAYFFTVVVWGKAAENIATYLTKGSLISVDGRLQNRTYETSDKEKRYVTEVVADLVQFLHTPKKKEDKEEERQEEDIILDDEFDMPF